MKIPILMYHALLDGGSNREKYAIGKEDFERQLAYLADEGYSAVPLDSLSAPRQQSPGKRVLITFDDGNYSDYSIALPLLKRYGLTATFFVTTGRVGSDRYLDWTHLKEMSSAGMSIQSHGMTHSFLSGMSRDALYRELKGSKEVIEEKINEPVYFLSLPGGFCSRTVLNLAQETGYRGVCTSEPGLNREDAFRRDFMVLRRFVITRNTTFKGFEDIVRGDARRVSFHRAEYYLKQGMKRVLGGKAYYAIWSRYFKNIQAQ